MAKQATNTQIVVLDARVIKYEGKTQGQKDGSRKQAVVGSIIVLGEKPYTMKLFIDIGQTEAEILPHTAYHAEIEMEARSNEKGQQYFVPSIRYIGAKARDFKLV